MNEDEFKKQQKFYNSLDTEKKKDKPKLCRIEDPDCEACQ